MSEGKKQEGPAAPFDVQLFGVKEEHGMWLFLPRDKDAAYKTAGDASRVTAETRTFHPYDYLGMMSQKPTDEIVRAEKSEGVTR